MSNLRLALRMLFRTPALTAIAILSLAIGIGANAAIFSLYNQMLMRPLPVADPYGLVNLGSPGPKSGSQSSNSAGSQDYTFSYPMFRDLEKAKTRFSGIGAHRLLETSLSFQGQTTAGLGMLVSGSYFGVLGLTPAAGRLIGPEDDRTPGAPGRGPRPRYWRTRFAMSPAIIGSTIVVNAGADDHHRVAPEGFWHDARRAARKISSRSRCASASSPGSRASTSGQPQSTSSPGCSLAAIEQAKAAVDVPYAAIVNDVEAGLQERT
jgi:hypothetical protein